uniref:interleukin-12 receptor subunit beta-2 n=1 Tax=Semicossyphus pulcher TaxID=241346 RepID=UPI0037E96578
MSRTWTILTAVTVLAAQLCIGQKSCSIWSTAGRVVQHGSSFQVYCTFKCKNKKIMSSHHPSRPLSHKELNSTTIYFNVVKINKLRTFSCQGSCPTAEDPCGIDIQAGYPPEHPQNISCIYNVRNLESGNVACTWNRGRDTLIKTNWTMWVRTVSVNHTVGPVPYNVSSKDALLPATFPVSRSVQLISVWVRVENDLGSAVSAPINYTLRDIAMPSAPVLDQPECFSRKCVIKVEQSVRTQHLEIQYRAEAQDWTSYPDSGVQMSQAQDVSVSSLEPFKLYHFRARSRLSSGQWSQWSTHVSVWTQEEAPAKELDVWYTEVGSDFKSLRVYWKELNISIARGQIIQYNVSVYNQTSRLLFTTNVGAEARNCSVQFCALCEVKVWAYNSKGPSPPARITTQHTKAKYSQDVHVAVDNHSVTISWRKHGTAPLHAGYVVEWYPEGHKLQALGWVRLGRNNKHFVISGMRPAECYEGAVYVYYSDNSVDQTRFTGAILESVPAAGPSVQEKVDGNKVKVTWTEIFRGQRGGCITKYTIYLENVSGHQQHYSIQAPERTYTIQGLTPAIYSLWVTASTARGEGPAGQKVKFFIQQEAQLSFVLVCAAVFPFGLFLLCLWQFSAVKQRFWRLFECLMLDAVLDPANSRWAKECMQEKGKMNLHLPPSNINVTEEEEEPILVDVEELPNQGSETRSPPDVSSQLAPQTSLSPLKEPATVTTYIKSFSLDSDSSDHTHTSLDTNSTVDYISSHGLGNMEEEDQEDEEFPDMAAFFPCHNIFTEPLKFGGMLTLDAVKINCNDFFQNSEC